jgi:hypothetical protein
LQNNRGRERGKREKREKKKGKKKREKERKRLFPSALLKVGRGGRGRHGSVEFC